MRDYLKSGMLLMSLLLINNMLISQDWLDMDGGLWSLNGTVKKVKVNPFDSLVYVCGDFMYSGNNETIKGFGFWNNISNLWQQSIYNGFACGCFATEFFEGNIYYGGSIVQDGELYGVGLFIKNDDNWILLDEGPNYYPRYLQKLGEDLYCLGGFDQVGDLSSFGIGIYDGENFSSIAVNPELDALADANDAVLFNDEVYITGKNLKGFPYYDWRCFAKIENEELVVAHEEFTGSFS